MNITRKKCSAACLFSLFGLLLFTGCSNEPASDSGTLSNTPDGAASGSGLPVSEQVEMLVSQVGTVPESEQGEPVVTDSDAETDTGYDGEVLPEQNTESSSGEDAELDREQPEPEASAANRAIEFGAQLYVATAEDFSGISTVATARFSRFASPLSDEPQLRPMNALDTCEIGSEASQINAESLDYPIDHMLATADNAPIQVAAVAAGESVELATDAGSYLSLAHNTVPEGTVNFLYQGGAQMTMAVPPSLSVSVAGADFPALNWQWDKPPLLVADLRAAVRSASSNAELVWGAAVQSDSVQSKLLLHAGYINELTGAFQSFQCELNDDGAFTLPDDVQALYANGFAPNFVDVARYTRSVLIIDGVSIINVFVQKL